MTFSVQNGFYAYKKEAPVLQDVSFEVHSGELCAILGPNGAGKTTLLRCAMGFLRWTKGESLLDGRSIAEIPARTLWKNLAYVPQAKAARLSCTVGEMVLLGRGGSIGALSQPGARDYAVMERVLGELGILKLKNRHSDELSGGELQMVLIARALAAEPQVLILDEPESNLDFRNQLLVMDTLTRLSREGMTCIFNTHYPAHALRCAHKALLLGRDGHTAFGASHEIITQERIEEAFGVRAVIGEIAEGIPDIVPVSVVSEERV